MTKLTLIWAQAHERAIGRDNTLPWSVPEDLKHFKAVTLGRPVIMGRKTFQSLGRPLPGRHNIVITSDPASLPPTVTAVNSLDAALAAFDSNEDRVSIIGGGTVYEASIHLADEIHVTNIDLNVEGADAWAPMIPAEFKLSSESEWLTSSTGTRYRYQHWIRHSD